MFADELDNIERSEIRACDPRERRRRLPVDSSSQLDTGYTGRPDTDVDAQVAEEKLRRERFLKA